MNTRTETASPARVPDGAGDSHAPVPSTLAKRTPVRDRAYLDHLRDEPCIFTGLRGYVDPAHIGTAGRGMKSGDDEALPIAHHLHQEGHNSGEVSMIRRHAPDWLLREAFRAYARQMYRDWLGQGKSDG